MKCPYCGNEIPDKSEQCDICGVELTKEDTNGLTNIATSKTIDKFGGIYFIICGLFTIGFGIAWTVAISGMLAFKFIPIYGFAIIGIGVMAYGLTYILTGFDLFTGKNTFDKVTEFLNASVSYIMLSGFAVFWFGVLIIADYQILTHPEENGGMGTFYFTLIFWLAGIVLLVNNIRKKKK